MYLALSHCYWKFEEADLRNNYQDIHELSRATSNTFSGELLLEPINDRVSQTVAEFSC